MSLTTKMIRKGKTVAVTFYDDATSIDMKADHVFKLGMSGLERRGIVGHARQSTIAGGSPVGNIETRSWEADVMENWEKVRVMTDGDGVPQYYGIGNSSIHGWLITAGTAAMSHDHMGVFDELRLNYAAGGTTVGAWMYFFFALQFDTEHDAAQALHHYQQTVIVT